MNFTLLIDVFSAMTSQKNDITLPLQLAQAGTNPMHSSGFSLEKLMSPLLISSYQNQKLVSSGLLSGESDIPHQQDTLIGHFSEVHEGATPVPIVNQRNQIQNSQQLDLISENLSIGKILIVFLNLKYT